MQKEVQRYVKESLTIILEIAASKFDLETFQAMTGLKYPTEQIKEQAKVQLQMMTAQAQMSGQQPPPPDPKMLQLLQTPSWEEVMQVLRSPITRAYKTDIETNSTIDSEAAQDKQDISELMNALSQLLMSLTPMVEKGYMPFDVAKEMLLTISRRFNFGPQLEDSLMKMSMPKPQNDENGQAEAAAKQAEAAAKVKEIQMNAQIAEREHQHKMELMAMEQSTAKLNAQISQDEARLRANAVKMKMAQQEAAHRQKMQQIEAQKEPANAAV